MSRLDVNRSGEIEVFVRVVDLGGFSAAARAFNITPSAVSKLVSRLESRLGVRLINRSTRKLQLTAEGAAFHERGLRILEDLAAAEREAATGAEPQGRLRINSNVPFGLHYLLPLLPGFLALYPQIKVDIALTDRVVDLIAERADVAIRTGPLRESSLIARKLGDSRMMVVAAPGYLKTHGTPETLADLDRHNQLGFCFTRHIEGWPFADGHGAITTMALSGNALVSDGEALRQLALAGLGLARLSSFHIMPDVVAGRLVPVLENYNAGDIETMFAVYVGQGGHLPARVRAFLDYLAQNVRFP